MPRPWLGTFILKCLFCFISIWLETSTFFLSELSLSRSLICSSYLGIGHLNHYFNRNDTYLLCTKDYSKTSFPSNTETQLFKGILLLIIAWLRLLSSVYPLYWHCGSANCHFFNAFLLFYSHQQSSNNNSKCTFNDHVSALLHQILENSNGSKNKS